METLVLKSDVRLLNRKLSNNSFENAVKADKPKTHFASERVLAKDWLTTEEDQAWKHL